MRGDPVIDEVYYLQGFKGGWTNWEEKMNITECLDARNGGFHQVRQLTESVAGITIAIPAVSASVSMASCKILGQV